MSSNTDSLTKFPVFMTISGIIGAGKSTLAEALAKRLNLPVYFEPVQDNVYLADFYKDIAKHAFAMQVYLLNARFRQQQEIIWSNRGGIQDRSIYEDSIFAKMLYKTGMMDKRDYETYVSLFQNLSHFMQKPNFIVHLDVSPEESLRRIQMRSRDCESSITLEYLTHLHQGYEEFLSDISKAIPVIKVNYQQFPSTEEMVEEIAKAYEKLSNITPVFYEQQPKSCQQAQAQAQEEAPSSTTE